MSPNSGLPGELKIDIHDNGTRRFDEKQNEFLAKIIEI